MLKIGWSKREISVPYPVSIPGQMYIRVSEGILDPLFVTALCLENGEKEENTVIFCSCDLTSLRGDVVEGVQEKLKKRGVRFPVENVIMNATHTHASVANFETPPASPDGVEIYPGLKYREFFIQQAADAILEAWEGRKPGSISYGYGYAVTGHCRRTVYFDDVSLRKPNAVAPNGHGVMYGKADDPQFSHFETGADHFLNALFTFDKEEKLTGIIVNVPCPSQLCEHFRKLTADFWTDVREMAAEEFGKDVYILPQCAAAGDISPRTLFYLRAQARRMRLKYGLSYEINPEAGTGILNRKDRLVSRDEFNKVMAERKDIAERILASLKEVYAWASKEKFDDPVIRHRYELLPLKKRMINGEEEDWCRANIKAMENAIPKSGDPEETRVAVSMYESVKRRNEKAIRRRETQEQDPAWPAPVHFVQVGEVGFATVPVELFMDFMHRIQARSPFLQTFIIQLAGGCCPGSYLATERAAKNKGYSASIFCNHISPEGGQQFVERTLEVLEDFCKE